MSDFKIPISKSGFFASLPPVWPEDVKPRIRDLLAASPWHKLIVLDDDPTGTQTVYGVPVLTTWEPEVLARELASDAPCFYVLTNSRSLVAEEAKALMEGVATSLSQALKDRGDKDVAIPVSRSDSTLRGHFPLETDVLNEELGPFDAKLLIPYFEAGGRYTIHDVHYVAEGDLLTPAAETPFAKDAVFGYHNSNLREWVWEKSGGRTQPAEVASVSLETLRIGGPGAVCAELMSLARGCICIVNAAALRDMEVFALGMLMAETQGRRYLLRSAAQIVAARLGLESRPLLTAGEMNADGAGGGLIIVGSYVPKTTEQLSYLLANTAINRVEISVLSLIDETTRSESIEKALDAIHSALHADRDVVVFTSRELVTGEDAAHSLQIGNRVSAALVEVVRRLAVRPRYIIAKGGITSSDLATQALGVKRAMVSGQLLPGVPVWQLGAEARFPGLGYVIFPGNVGGPSALTDAISKLTATVI